MSDARHLLCKCLISLCVLAMFGCSASRRIAPPDVLRLASIHIDHARGNDGRVDLKRVARLLRTIDADVVALQGVDRWAERSGKSDQIVSLAEALEMTYTYHRVSQLVSGESGNSLLTRFPIIEERHVTAGADDGSASFMLVVLERRGQQLVIVNTDLGTDETRSLQTGTFREIEARTEALSPALRIVCGYTASPLFTESDKPNQNAFRARWREVRLNREGKDVAANREERRGFILVDRRSIESERLFPISAETVEPDLSPYRPIIVDFRIKAD